MDSFEWPSKPGGLSQGLSVNDDVSIVHISQSTKTGQTNLQT